jgi:hypothetical protein
VKIYANQGSEIGECMEMIIMELTVINMVCYKDGMTSMFSWGGEIIIIITIIMKF